MRKVEARKGVMKGGGGGKGGSKGGGDEDGDRGVDGLGEGHDAKFRQEQAGASDQAKRHKCSVSL